MANAESILTPYNAVVLSTFTQISGSDMGGGLEVGGVSNVPGYWQVADDLNDETTANFTNGTTVVLESSVTNGPYQTKAGNYYDSKGGVNNAGSGSNTTTEPYGTVSSQFTTFQSESAQIGAESTTGTDAANLSGGVLTINVNYAGLNIVGVTQAQIDGLNTLDFVTGTGVTLTSSTGTLGNAWVILNIAGTADTFKPASGTFIGGSEDTGDDLQGESVLYNFYQMKLGSGQTINSADTLTLGGSVAGSILAPGANVSATGDMLGSLVSATYSGTDEFHNVVFLGSSFTPEPAPVACIGLGLVALALVRRRRHG